MPKTTSSNPKTSSVAFCKPRLERTHEVLSGYIDRKEMSGLVALVSHEDDVHVETLGTKTLGGSVQTACSTLVRVLQAAHLEHGDLSLAERWAGASRRR